MDTTPPKTSFRPQSVDADPALLVADGVPVADSPSLAAIVASVVPKTRPAIRARVLRRLLMPVGPLALTALAGGAFAKYLQFARWSRISVSLEDAARVTSSQIGELVRYVDQSDPTVLEQVIVVLSRDATTMAALGASVAVIAMQLRSSRKSAGRPPPRTQSSAQADRTKPSPVSASPTFGAG